MTKSSLSATTKPTQPRFWRDQALDFIEARSIEDARDIHYDKHAHEAFSIGVITGGSCVYLNERKEQHIGAGSLVLMNPGDVHACNPIRHEQWSYRMLYVDIAWLTNLQRDLGVGRSQFAPFSTTAIRHPQLYTGLNHLYDILIDGHADLLEKHEVALTFMIEAQRALSPTNNSERRRHRGVARAAEFIRDNYKQALKLQDICSAADLSASYLIRAFKDDYGMTPHAYLINCRVEFSRARLRKGVPIADVAFEAGFADQAHLQRTFKRLVAATPAQYR